MVTFGRTARIKFVGGVLNIKVRGQDSITQELTGVIRRSSDLRVPFEAFRPVWIDAIQENFDAEGDPVPWPELSPAYAGWKSSAYPGQKMLRLTDRMYDSLTSMTSDTIWRTTPRTIQFGSRVPYFIYHQEGTSKMPARPMMTLPPHASAALVTMVMNYIKTGKP